MQKIVPVNKTISKSKLYYRYFALDWNILILIDIKNNEYKWLPDYPSDASWINTRNLIEIKMKNFCEFWYNRRKYKLATGARIAFNSPFLAFFWGGIRQIPSQYINSRDANVIHILDNVFLPYIKNNINIENSITWI
jgi:hypothetical protein